MSSIYQENSGGSANISGDVSSRCFPEIETETESEMQMHPTWRWIGESVCGTSHLRSGLPCQDRNRIQVTQNDILLVAIADGAGSASHSELGAEEAVATAIQILNALLDQLIPMEITEEMMREAIETAMKAAKDAIIVVAEKDEISPRELACTLILAAISPFWSAAGQIGDGAAVIQDANGEMHSLTTPDSGEYINETTFLVSPDALERMQFCFLPGGANYLAAFSDGLQMIALKMPGGLPHPPFFAPLFRFMDKMESSEEGGTQLRSLLESPRITERADDDLTLVIAARRV